MPDRLTNATRLLWITVVSIILAGVLKYAQWFIGGTPLAEILQGTLGVLVLLATTVGGVGIAILLSDLVAAWVRPVHASARRILVSMGATMVGLSVAVSMGAQVGGPRAKYVDIPFIVSHVVGEALPVVGSVLVAVGLLSRFAVTERDHSAPEVESADLTGGRVSSAVIRPV